MSVYIKGIKMPSECCGLRLIIYPNGSVLFPHSTYFEELNGVKAIHVPDHGRLIDADAMIEKYNSLPHRYDKSMVGMVSNCDLFDALVYDLRKEPTIIPAEKEGKE